MAVSIVWRGGAPFAPLKPSLFPFALFGIGQRAWSIGLATFIVLCLPFGAMWADWVTTVVNSRGAGLRYSALRVVVAVVLVGPYAW